MEKWKLLQLFAEGGEGEGSAPAEGNGAKTVDNGTADEYTKKLLELGVPKEKIRAKKNKAEAKQTADREPEATAPQGNAPAAEETKTEEATTTENAPKKPTWDEIMADPEYNKQMQSIVQERLKKSKTQTDAFGMMEESMMLLAKRHGLDSNNIDYKALNEAIKNDDLIYENQALEHGNDLETEKKNTLREVGDAIKARTVEEEMFENHLRSLEAQGEAMKATFPNFDLKTELKNPTFARMTSPNGGVSVEDAYYAVHRKDIQQATMQITAQKTAEQISNTIQAGQRRPSEAGTTGVAPSVTNFNYANASKEQRNALKERIRRGEKIYPGQEFK